MDNKAFWSYFRGAALGGCLGLLLGVVVQNYYEQYKHQQFPNFWVIVFGLIGIVIVAIIQNFVTVKKETIDRLRDDIDRKVNYDEFRESTNVIKSEFEEFKTLIDNVHSQVNFIFEWVQDIQRPSKMKKE